MIWQVWSIPSLQLLQGTLWPRVTAAIKVPSTGQRDRFKDFSYSIGQNTKKKPPKKLLPKKCKFVHTMNAIP